MRRKIQIMTGVGGVCLLLFSFGIYGFYKATGFLAGPDIVMEYPKSGQTVLQSYNTAKGKAVNISSLRVNGRQIFTDEEGNFETSLLLAEGYNIIEVKANDKFNREIRKLIEVVYK